MRGSGVQVVTISPGYIDTPLTRRNRYPMPFLMRAEAFAERARHGIPVKLLVDAVGSAMLGDEILGILRNGGCQLAWFRPISAGSG